MSPPCTAPAYGPSAPFAADITQTYPPDDPRATRWAQGLHTHTHTDAAGPAWSSKQDDERDFVLWGDRIPGGALVPETAAPGGHGPHH